MRSDKLGDAANHLQNAGGLDVLYLTTTGRISGQLREIEIWFVTAGGKLYILAEHFRKAQWVRNIETDANVTIRLGARQFAATARVLDKELDAGTWDLARNLSIHKYGWGEGLPVEIVPQ